MSHAPPLRTVLPPEDTAGLGALTVMHPAGTFPPSPATRATVKALGVAQGELRGTGFDWGCGVGVLALAATRVPEVRGVIGLDISPLNIEAARRNAALNGAAACASFYVSDSFCPVSEEGRAAVDHLEGRGDFLVANPPASGTGDGFDFRRRVLRDGLAYLRAGAPVLLQALSVYGSRRVLGLMKRPGGYAYEGVAFRTPLVSLDLARRRMREQLETYVRAEAEGARPYRFAIDRSGDAVVSASEALEAARKGATLWARWEVHRFRKTA